MTDNIKVVKKNSAIFPLTIILLIAAALRIFYFLELKENPIVEYTAYEPAFDQARFVRLAKEILQSHWIGPVITQTSITYSYFIAFIFKLFGEDVYRALLFQFILGIWSIMLLYKATHLLFQNRKVGLLAAVMAAFYAPFIYMEGCLLRTAAITYINLLVFYVLLKASHRQSRKLYFLSGLTMGLSVMLQPNILPFFIILYIYFTVNGHGKKKIVSIVLVISGIILVTSPLLIRNKLVQGNLDIEPQGLEVFWVGNTPLSSGIAYEGVHPELTRLVTESAGNMNKTISVFLKEVKKQPRVYWDLYMRKISMYFNGYEIPSNLSFDLFKENSLALKLAFLDFTFICPLGILGAILSFKKFRYSTLALLFLSVLSLCVITFHILERYRMPAIPYFIIFASYGMYWLSTKFQKKRIFVFTFGVISLAVLFNFSFPKEKILKQYSMQRIRDIDYSNFANAYYLEAEENWKNLSAAQRNRLVGKAVEFWGKALGLVSREDFRRDYLANM